MEMPSEALIGAIYLDTNYQKTKIFCYKTHSFTVCEYE
jgi:dsRNA-specific ribonuclease